VVTALTVAPLLAALPATTATAAPAATPSVTTTVNPIAITISRITPIAPQPGDTLVVAGTLTNTSTSTISDILYALKFSSVAVSSRGSFDGYATDQDGLVSDLSGPASVAKQANPSYLAPGASEPFQIAYPIDSAAFGPTWQVRDMGVSVSSGTTPVGHLRTFLPWAPRATPAGSPVRVAWMWPLIDRPHRTTASNWVDDDLAAEVAPNGRLAELVSAGVDAETQQPIAKHGTTRSVPLAWVIDPMLTSDVQQMTTPYRVTTSAGTTDGTGTADAKTWLTSLRSAVSHEGDAVLALPYADPDVVAAVRAGFTAAIGVANTNGRGLLGHLLGVTPLPYGWPVAGLTDQRSLNALSAIGDTSIVLSGAAVPPLTPPSETPSAHTQITTSDGTIDTLLTDATLDEAINSGVDNPDGWRVSLQRYLAETLMIYAEAPNNRRDVIVSPNRRWTPDPSYASALLADTGKVPWITPVSLSDVQKSPISTTTPRQPLTYPEAAKHNELSPTYLHRVSALRRDITDFGAILPIGNAETRGFTQAAQATLSSAWRVDHDAANRTLDTLVGEVTHAMNGVRITSLNGSYITLTSHGGKIPITIENNLQADVRVVVHLDAHERLVLDHQGKVAVTVPAGQQTVVDVHADAKTSGVFPLDVQLLTPKGQLYGDQVDLYVRSTVYGTITLVITGAATAALMVAVAVRLVRRALRARRSAANA
jgi:hypothetical protein